LYSQTRVEDIFESDNEYSGQFYDFDIIEKLIRNKIDINSAVFDDLILIPGITPILAVKIIRHRQDSGFIKSEKELDYLISNLNLDRQAVKEFLRFQSKEEPVKTSFEIRQRIQESIDKSRGFEESYYYRSPVRNYTRIKFTHGNKVTGSFHCEKDPGEKDFLDHTVSFLDFKDVFGFNKVVVGDYYLNFAQGMVFYRDRYFGQFTDPIYPVITRSKGIRGYSSSNEQDGFRGIAAEKPVKNGKLFVFFSRNNLDGNLTDVNTVSGLYTTGTHRNDFETMKKDVVKEDLIGTRLEYNPIKRLSIGISAAKYNYNKNFVSFDSLRNRDRFTGNGNFIFSGDLDLLLPEMNFFMEFARSGTGGYGFLSGVLFDRENVQALTLLRRYTPDFHSLHGNSYVSGSADNRNESGEMIGLRLKLNKHSLLSISYDQFRSLSRTYFYPFIERGIKTMIRFEYNQLFSILYNLKDGDYRDSSYDKYGISREYSVKKAREKIRLELKKNVLKDLLLKARYESVWERSSSRPFYINEEDGVITGSLFFVDLTIRKLKRCSFSLRNMHFKSDQNLLVYQYERDLPGVLLISPLKGSGRKWYFVVNIKLSRFLSCSGKYSETVYYSVDSIGSGWDQIAGNRKRIFGVQLDFTF